MLILKELKSKLTLIEEQIRINTLLAMSASKESESHYQFRIKTLEKDKVEILNEINKLYENIKTN